MKLKEHEQQEDQMMGNGKNIDEIVYKFKICKPYQPSRD